MTEPANHGPNIDAKTQGAAQTKGLPRRDYFLIPLISIATVALMFVAAEVVCRVIWVSDDRNVCRVPDESPVGYHYKSNCAARSKSAEGQWVSYRYNDCGYRSDTSCKAVPAGAARIAIIGASVSQALNIPDEQTYYAITAASLSHACKRLIDIQNLGKPGASPLYAYRSVDEAIALKPDVIVLLLAPFDLEQQIDPKALAARNDPAPSIATPAVVEPLSLMRRAQLLLTDSRTVLVAEHFLLQNKDTFLRLYLHYGDKADFLRQPLSVAWQKRFADIDVLIGGMTDKMRASGIPFMVVPVPSRAEAALLSSSEWPAGVNPIVFGKTIEEIATNHGAFYVDLMEPFRHIRNSQDLFLVVDGHVSTEGQKIIARELTQALLRDDTGLLRNCAKATSSERTR
jgi:hypothetical protein